MKAEHASQLGVAFSLLLAGCGSSGVSWREALGQVDLDRSIFSLAYVAAPPDGTYLTLAAHVGADADSACRAYENQQLPTDLWYFAIDTTSTGPGIYTVVDRISPPSESPLATVRFVHVKNGEKIETIGAVRGEVEVVAAPASAEEWHATQGFDGSLSVELPVEAWRERTCAGGQGADASTPIVTSCECVGPGGRTAQCTPETASDNCCSQLGVAAGSFPFSAHVAAKPCPWMCKFTGPSLARECLALL